MLTVKGPWLPGFSEPDLFPKTADFLTKRKYNDQDGGPALFMAMRNALMGNVNIVSDCVTKEGQFTYDVRSQILASCLRHNCKSHLWWMVERDEQPSWSVYAATWNETYAILVLETSGWGSPQSHGKEIPLIVMSDEVEQSRMLLDLGIA